MKYEIVFDGVDTCYAMHGTKSLFSAYGASPDGAVYSCLGMLCDYLDADINWDRDPLSEDIVKTLRKEGIKVSIKGV